MTLARGIGLGALIVVIISFWIPLIGVFVAWFALLLASLAALCGDRFFSIATVIVGAITFFFSTSLWVDAGIAGAATSADDYGTPVLLAVSVILLLAPILAMILFATGRLALRRPQPRASTGV